MMIRGTLPGLLLAVSFLSAACGLLPGGNGDRTIVTVTPPGRDKPNTISAATIVTPLETFREAIADAGAGLRTGGERKGIHVHYGVLDSAAQEFLLETLGIGADAFSTPVGVAPGDEVEIRGRRGSTTEGHCTAHLLPLGSGDSIRSLEVGIVARPADGSLLPVMRASIPLTGSGTYLLSFESGAGETFGLFLRLDLAGEARAAGTVTYRRHRLSVRSFTVGTDDLSRILRLEDIEERGGLGGIVLENLRQSEAESLVKALSEDGRAGPETTRILSRTANTSLLAGGLNLLVRSEFAPARAMYATEISVQNRGAVPPLSVTHGDRDVLLLLGWDAESPGTSVVALLTVTPVD